MALHLPLFAAAAAHYDRADATAPRLVALDEAFAGIDEAIANYDSLVLGAVRETADALSAIDTNAASGRPRDPPCNARIVAGPTSRTLRTTSR